MGGRRAPDKETLSRPNDQARRDAETVKITADSKLRGPELPEGEWHPRTLEWWRVWRTSAQAKRFAPTDWEALAEAALLHTRMWNGEVSVAPELRLRVAKHGATLEDRQKLKIDIDVEADEAGSAPVANLDNERALRLARAAGDGS